MKRLIAAILLLTLLASAGCSGAGNEPEPTTDPTQVNIDPTAAPTDDPLENFMGYIVANDGSINTYTAMHGFLRAAESLGYPAKLFLIGDGVSAEDAVRAAAAAGCKGVLVEDRNGENDAAVSLALSLGMEVVVPYDRCTVAGLKANVVADSSEYIGELARSIAERMVERDLKSGRILVYGWDTSEVLPLFEEAVAEYYPQYNVSAFTRTQTDREAAIAELAEYLLNNRDIKGLYAIDADDSVVAVYARKKAQKDFRSFRATPQPSPTPDALGNVPTPIPSGLLTAVKVSVFGTNLSDETLELFDNDNIYALCIEPYYDASNQAVIVLDRLMSGEEVPEITYVNRPIIRYDTVDKYAAIYEEVKAWFGLS